MTRDRRFFGASVLAGVAIAVLPCVLIYGGTRIRRSGRS